MDKNQGYSILKAVMLENGRGFALGHHPTAPSPYVLSLIHIYSSLPFQLSFINRRSHSRSRYKVNIPQVDVYKRQT